MLNFVEQTDYDQEIVFAPVFWGGEAHLEVVANNTDEGGPKLSLSQVQALKEYLERWIEYAATAEPDKSQADNFDDIPF
jgi:hypothetical protein